MQITRETDYAIRCILHMASAPGKIYVVNEISKPQLIPKDFLAKILQKLVKAGLVKSSRGIKGGFRLTKNPDEISLYDVVSVIEGSVPMNRCVIDERLCSLSNTCSVHPVWIRIRKEVEKQLKQQKFDALIKKR